MLIAGAGGFAKTVLEVAYQLDLLENLVFYDDINEDIPINLFDRFSILRDIDSAKHYFSKTDRRFALGIGNPFMRQKLAYKLQSIGGELITLISPEANVGHFGTKVGQGTVILTGTVISNSVSIGEGCLINMNCTIGHDARIGAYAELSPGVFLGGNSNVGNLSSLGAGCTVLAKVNVGDHTVIGAGAVVIKDIPQGVTAIGVPAKIITK
jgi:sugar O-acyltransferase (sialic acid O-acetyltransferase NeuD family)